MTDLLRTALTQSAIDCGCLPEDFLWHENIAVRSRPHPQARKYLELPFLCNLVSYGHNIVISATEPFAAPAAEFASQFPVEHCFETPALHVLSGLLRPLGADICYMAEYWLPDPSRIPNLPCPYETRLLGPADFAPLYRPEWSNALCEKRKHLDVLGVGAYDRGKLVGLAGCSADCAGMWQIGIDVLPEYRLQGIASALTSTLAREILARGKVPFYCCAWANLKSARNALKSGFYPAWVEMTAKPLETINAQNRQRPAGQPCGGKEHPDEAQL